MTNDRMYNVQFPGGARHVLMLPSELRPGYTFVAFNRPWTVRQVQVDEATVSKAAAWEGYAPGTRSSTGMKPALLMAVAA